MAPLMWRLPIMGIEFMGKGAKELEGLIPLACLIAIHSRLH